MSPKPYKKQIFDFIDETRKKFKLPAHPIAGDEGVLLFRGGLLQTVGVDYWELGNDTVDLARPLAADETLVVWIALAEK